MDSEKITLNIAPALDISADLIELSHTPILLVSAGVKSILDIGRTLEFIVSIFACFTESNF
jgi:pseudouridine-5'-phosphate glycosidase